MSSYKVEICGVNTAKLPVLKEEEKDALKETRKQHECICRRQVRSRKGEMTYVNT
jgi:RNA polymerase sporulation-specific sigma factor